jgi:pimeloyl-ACP methyl ester carboxylesterase
VAAVGLLALAYVVICGYMALTLTQTHHDPLVDAPEHYGLSYESVSFSSRIDAVQLDGWLLNPPTGAAARRPIVVVHGWNSDRAREANKHMLAIAAQLTGYGYPTLLFDLRGSGRSAGERFTLGVQEVRDVGGAIDFLEQRGLAVEGVDLLGYSMGAATALLAAPDEPLVRAVAEDSGYADLRNLLDTEVPKASGLPGFFTPGVVFAARPIVGADLYALRPIDGVSGLAAHGVPLLVIHGQADGFVAVDNGYRIAAAYGPKVQTLFAPGADHVRSYEIDPTTYIARLSAFFEGVS